jgi:16S rRNA (guanine966-N2)-methyltransferase
VRPTQDRVREALFSVLGERVAGARVLDLFAGAGALGLEAWSRGAAGVCWVEGDRRTFRVLKQNVDELCAGERAGCVLSDVYRFLKRGPVEQAYDLVLADPPYEETGASDALRKTLHGVRQRPILAPAGLLVFEQRGSGAAVQPPGWRLLKRKTYGGTGLLFYALAVPAVEETEP